jgi:hypothetical protein
MMKKTLTSIAFSLLVAVLPAQDNLTSKKGEPILPEKGDWGIGIDANPFLNYLGNFFGKGGQSTTVSGTSTVTTAYSNTAPTWNFLTANQTITGKYFLDAKTALRGSVRLGFNTNTSRKTVEDIVTAAAVTGTAAAYPNPVPTTENSWKHNTWAIGVSGGIEKRKGTTRLQGYYGGEVGFYIGNSRDKFSYGNALVPAGPGVTTPVGVNQKGVDDFGTAAANVGTIAVQSNSASPIMGRVLDRKNGSTFSLGARLIVGAEYFFLPKMSIGGEFGMGIGVSTTGATSSKWESIGISGATNSTAQESTTTLLGSKQGGFTLDTDGKNSIWGPTGTLRLNLYF